MTGKRGKAPCGHLGEAIIGQYYQCAKCDKKAAPKYIDPEKTQPLNHVYLCTKCASTHTIKFSSGLEALGWYIQQPLYLQTHPPEAGDVGCHDCGNYWTPTI